MASTTATAFAERVAQIVLAVVVVALWTATAAGAEEPGPEPSETMTAFYRADVPPGTTEVLWQSLREHWSNPNRPVSAFHPPIAGHIHRPGQPRIRHPYIPRRPWQCVTSARLHADRSTNTGCAVTVLTEYGPKTCLVVTMRGGVYLMYVED